MFCKRLISFTVSLESIHSLYSDKNYFALFGLRRDTLLNSLGFLTQISTKIFIIRSMSLDLANTVKKLESYNNAAFPILSVYLSMNQDSHQIQQQFNALITSKLDVAQKKIFAPDQQEIIG